MNIPAQVGCMEAEFPGFVVCVCFCWDFFRGLVGFFSVLERETLCVG